MLNIIKYTLEGIADGNAAIEKELVYHAILEDMSVLDNAAREELQEQWEIKIPKTEPSISPSNLTGGTLRVRKIVIPNVRSPARYVFCSKTKSKDENLEVELVSTKDQFDQFVAMSTGGMLKMRYYFPIEGTENSFPDGEFNGCLVWEIDVFKRHPQDDIIVEWVKIDLELPETWGNKPVPEFPFATKQIITSQYGKRTEEEEAIVSKLYEDDFCIRH